VNNVESVLLSMCLVSVLERGGGIDFRVMLNDLLAIIRKHLLLHFFHICTTIIFFLNGSCVWKKKATPSKKWKIHLSHRYSNILLNQCIAQCLNPI